MFLLFLSLVTLLFDDVETMEKNLKELNGKEFLGMPLNLKRPSFLGKESEVGMYLYYCIYTQLQKKPIGHFLGQFWENN